LTYDLMLERDGRALLYMPLSNYADYNLDALREKILDPVTTIGLSDGGAHCGLICDASMPTYMLQHWVRDRSRGERLPVEVAIKRQTSDTARFYGLNDRGALKPGMKADVNVIDLEGLTLHAPRMVFDLPAGERKKKYLKRYKRFKRKKQKCMENSRFLFKPGDSLKHVLNLLLQQMM